jgi:cysteine protease ATG4
VPHHQRPNTADIGTPDDMEIIKPLTTYTLDEVDVDALSDDSNTTSSPTNRVRRSTIRPVKIDSTRTTPPGSPTRRKVPDSPTTPLAPSPSRPPAKASVNSTDPTHIPERTRSRSTDDDITSQKDSSSAWFASAYTEAQLRTFHCDKVKKIPLSNVDPSMLLGFLCKNEADFEDFCERVNKVSFLYLFFARRRLALIG